MGDIKAEKVLDPLGIFQDPAAAPTPPDFNAATQRQGWSTRPNQSNPFASSTWTRATPTAPGAQTEGG